MKILILCTGNSCRSQMAHGFLYSFDKKNKVRSAGTFPASKVSQMAIEVMAEVGIDISSHTPKNVSHFLNSEWDYVITVCDNAKEMCPVFSGRVNNHLHIGFEDPSDFKGTGEQVRNEFRRVRDEIHTAFKGFYDDING